MSIRQKLATEPFRRTRNLTLTRQPPPATRDIRQARHECCNIAAVRLGGHSYYAAGQAGSEELAALLNALPAPAQALH